MSEQADGLIDMPGPSTDGGWTDPIYIFPVPLGNVSIKPAV
jgi:hypothetical protein